MINNFDDTISAIATVIGTGGVSIIRLSGKNSQEIISKISSGSEMPTVLDSVLQPHVEVYKKNLKPQADGKDVVVAGRIS